MFWTKRIKELIINLFRNGVRSDGLAPVLVEKHNPLIRLVPKSIECLLFSLKIMYFNAFSRKPIKAFVQNRIQKLVLLANL